MAKKEWNEYDEWETIPLTGTAGKSAPFVSIGRGQMQFSAAACDLINDSTVHYNYARLKRRKISITPVFGVEFLTEFQDNAIPIKRKTANGKEVKGITIALKDRIEKMFSEPKYKNGMIRHSVTPVPNCPNILEIGDSI